jgi:hypothetical protein
MKYTIVHFANGAKETEYKIMLDLSTVLFFGIESRKTEGRYFSRFEHVVVINKLNEKLYRDALQKMNYTGKIIVVHNLIRGAAREEIRELWPKFAKNKIIGVLDSNKSSWNINGVARYGEVRKDIKIIEDKFLQVARYVKNNILMSGPCHVGPWTRINVTEGAVKETTDLPIKGGLIFLSPKLLKIKELSYDCRLMVGEDKLFCLKANKLGIPMTRVNSIQPCRPSTSFKKITEEEHNMNAKIYTQYGFAGEYRRKSGKIKGWENNG